jgi:DNA-binding GntR family transcriptional regulator
MTMVGKNESLADNVYFSLKNRILRGDILPGTALREESLSETYAVSRTPLRRALTQLMTEGYLVKGRDRTLRIPHISADELNDTLTVRLLLETNAAAEAARRSDKESVDRLEHFIWDEQEALKLHDNVLVSSLDRMFHMFIAQMSGNKVFEKFIGQLNYRVSFYLAISKTLGEKFINEALKEHNDILQAIKLKMPERASKAMKKHLEQVEERMLSAGGLELLDDPKIAKRHKALM